MPLSNARAKFGLSGSFTSAKEGVSGINTLGESDSLIRLTTCDFFYTRRFIFAASGTLLLDLGTNETAGSDSFVAGTAQVETATAAGTISTSGNATAIVTAAGMTGSPRTVTFAVVAGDTAAEWAAKARTAIAADTVIAARFTVGGSTTAITLTRIPTYFDSPVGDWPIHFANDATLNIALADATSAGITEAATSADTTAGVASTGVKIFGTDGKDHEGEDLPAAPGLSGIRFQNTGGAMTCITAGDTNNFFLNAGEEMGRANASGIGLDGTIEITASGSSCALSLTVSGYTG